MKILDVGCGPNKILGAMGIDKFQYEGVDIVADLNVFPWPLSDIEFDEIHFNSCLEHLVDIPAVMEEVYRISKPNAKVYISAPHFTSADCFVDVTHKHFFSVFSFDYFIYDIKGSFVKSCKYKILKKRIEFWELHEKIKIKPYFLIEMFANKFPRIYERFFAFIFPARAIHIVLEVIK